MEWSLVLSGPLFVYRISATIKRVIYVDILWCFCRRFPIFFAQFFSFVKLTICMSSFHFFLWTGIYGPTFIHPLYYILVTHIFVSLRRCCKFYNERKKKGFLLIIDICISIKKCLTFCWTFFYRLVFKTTKVIHCNARD